MLGTRAEEVEGVTRWIASKVLQITQSESHKNLPKETEGYFSACGLGWLEINASVQYMRGNYMTGPPTRSNRASG